MHPDQPAGLPGKYDHIPSTAELARRCAASPEPVSVWKLGSCQELVVEIHPSEQPTLLRIVAFPVGDQIFVATKSTCACKKTICDTHDDMLARRSEVRAKKGNAAHRLHKYERAHVGKAGGA